MNRLRIIILVLNILGLGAGIYFGARVGKKANDAAILLRDARVASSKALTDRNKAVLELETAQAELARLKLGWGFEWTIPPGGNVGSVQVVGTNLAVTGLGTNNGLVPRDVMVDGRLQPVAPTVHVFIPDGQTGSRYLGEFRADPQQLAATSATLVPTWAVNQQEIASWNFSQGVRMRSQVPPAERLAIEGLNQAIQRTRELIAETDASIVDQQQLLTAAQQQLAVRKGELLGNPAIPLIADRPEHTVGLVQALEDLEEDRNMAMLQVDFLRREIVSAADARALLISQLNELTARLPQPQTSMTQRDGQTENSPAVR